MQSARFLFSAFFLSAAVAQASVAPQNRPPVLQVPNVAQPQLTADSDGRVWLVYGQLGEAPPAPAAGQAHQGHGAPSRPGEVFVACSKDAGATFGPAVKAVTLPKLMLGMRRGPRIATHGDHVTVTMVGDELCAVRSEDGGRTWSQPVTINDVSTSAREGLHDLAAGPAGELFVTWLDLRNGKMELWSATSRDAGRTWAKNQQVYSSPDKAICECCHPTSLFDAEGNLAVMWRNSIEGSRDMWMTTRPKGATQFTPARKLGTGTWKLAACPMDGGRILALGGGKFGAVFQRAGEVFFVAAAGEEKLIGAGKQPIAVRRGGESLILWQQGADLVSVSDVGQPAAKRASDARFPVVVTLPNKGGTVLAYEQGPAKERQPGIVVERF
ncbi:MAG TPA: sialidase family protein [Opitutaceae bacterium]|nr:sialidase family protein [Opitutaceae bacterium]